MALAAWWSLARNIENSPVVSADFGAAAGGPSESRRLADADLPPAETRSKSVRAASIASGLAAAGEPRAKTVAMPGSERGLREKYLALEAAEPGYLAAHSQEWLGSPRPSAEKVAWLQALHKTDAVALLPWLEFTCRTHDPATSQGVSPAAFAADFLGKLAPGDATSKAALGRMAFDKDAVDVDLRRRAASTFAALADGLDLQTLAQALLYESDEALRAGVVVSLEARSEPETQLARDRLLAWLRPGSAAFLARQEDEIR